jgi:hypothetical protein
VTNSTHSSEEEYDYDYDNFDGDEIENAQISAESALAMRDVKTVLQNSDSSIEPADSGDYSDDSADSGGYAAEEDPPADASTTSDWVPLGGASRNVADDEGQAVSGPVKGDLRTCEDACDSTDGCESFAFCDDACYLKDKVVQKDDKFHYNKHCSTYRRGNVKDNTCYELFSNMAFNSLVQAFPNNPDSKAAGFATCKLCTNGTLTCTALVYGGQTKLIASHIHLAENGDGENGSGAPVISFCGDNTQGLINLNPPYPEMCAQYSSGSSSNNEMQGVLLDTPPNKGTAVADRVRDIAANPGHYYMNFHSIASWTYWSAQGSGPAGMCRGVMQLS